MKNVHSEQCNRQDSDNDCTIKVFYIHFTSYDSCYKLILCYVVLIVTFEKAAAGSWLFFHLQALDCMEESTSTTFGLEEFTKTGLHILLDGMDLILG